MSGIGKHGIFKNRRDLLAETSGNDLLALHLRQFLNRALYAERLLDDADFPFVHIAVGVSQIYGELKEFEMQHLLERHLFGCHVSDIRRLQKRRDLI